MRIGLLGSKGKMNQAIYDRLTKQYPNIEIVQTIRGESLSKLLLTDVILDFSSPEGTESLVREMISRKIENLPAILIGTTSLTTLQKEYITELSRRTYVFLSAYFVPGVHIAIRGLRAMADELEKFEYRVNVKETHHISKKDTISATAKSLRFAVTSGQPENIPIQSERVENFVSLHEVQIRGLNDQIKLTHTLENRSEIARWVIEIALWLNERRNRPEISVGLTGMSDFLISRNLSKKSIA